MKTPHQPTTRRSHKCAAAALIASTVAVPVALGTARVEAYQRYAVTANGVALRSGPGTNYPVLQRVNAGTPIDIVCQIQNGPSVGGNRTYDKLSGSQWLPDYYTSTPSFNSYAPGLGDCNAPQPTTGHPPATAQNIGYNPFQAHYSNQCTYYAEMRMAQQTGMYMPVTGNAYQWADQARAGGWTVGTIPAINSVVVFPAGSFQSSVGHVAFVVSIAGSTLRIQDYNWKYVGATVTDHWVTVPAGTQYIYSDK